MGWWLLYKAGRSQGQSLCVSSFPEPSSQSDLEKHPKILWDCWSFSKDFIHSDILKIFRNKTHV